VSRPVKFTPAAVADVRAAVLWYADRSAGAASRFLEELDRLAARLAEAPEQFPIVIANVRRARFRRFPYALFVSADAGEVFVIGCFHGRRDPLVWLPRIE
jgi:plasmid stabilization system protein ParE